MIKKRLKVISISIMAVLMSLGFIGTINAIIVCADHDVWGYAWSENIGWISFSCRDTMDVGDGVDYGVDIDGTGMFSGYAWSENIGWISFNEAELGGCPGGVNCKASIDMGTGSVSGWARALANGGGWDGWIGLNGSWADGVGLNSTPAPSEFEGWAWGSDVVGWISFNNTTGGGSVDYAVKTNLSIVANSSPTAVIVCNPSSCEVYDPDTLVLENESTDPEDNIVKSEWETKTQGASDSTYVPRDVCSVDPLCDLTPQNYVGIGNYTARLTVEDTGALSSTTTEDFSILRDASAGFGCSLDNSFWENCDTITPIVGNPIFFIDDEARYPSEFSRESQEAASIYSRIWQRSGDASSFSSANNQNPSVIALLTMEISLDIVDSAGRPASIKHIIGVEIPLPDWKEINPF